MNFVVFSLGSNSDNKELMMQACVDWMREVLNDVKVSQIYETKALNGIDNDYMNAVLSGYTNEEYDDIVRSMKRYEIQSGRTKESKLKGVIPIDVDVVMWNDKIMRNNDYIQSYFQIGWNEIK